tara:strand:+ start:1315 stop:2541 length:1227 start_codon:yes stop_codon:yes gene_type:complete
MDKLNYKLIIVFVGLPASGKSYTSIHIKKYLTWLGYNIKIFNCGNYRRQLSNKFHNAEFFDHKNEKNFKIRESFFYYCMFDLNSYLRLQNGNIGILDATNSTKLRRKKIINFFSHFNYPKRIIFLENITNDSSIINNNINFKKKSPDYINFTIEKMKEDFFKRIEYYRKIYEDIEDDEDIDYMKIYNCGKKILCNNVFGDIETLIVNYLINFRVNIKKIYISRHGQSLFNIENRIGGDPDITNEGYKYAKQLYNYISINYKPDEIIIFTSNLKRTKKTASLFIKNNYNVKHREILNEIDGGICENMTYEEVKEKMPELYTKRKNNKFEFKYPEGESYFDLIQRVKEFILELNRLDKPILIISHNAVIRVIFSYFFSEDHQKIPYLNIPLHKLFLIENNDYFYKKSEII